MYKPGICHCHWEGEHFQIALHMCFYLFRIVCTPAFLQHHDGYSPGNCSSLLKVLGKNGCCLEPPGNVSQTRVFGVNSLKYRRQIYVSILDFSTRPLAFLPTLCAVFFFRLKVLDMDGSGTINFEEFLHGTLRTDWDGFGWSKT